MKLVSLGNTNADKEFIFKVETPLSKLTFDIDFSQWSEAFWIPDLILRSSEYTPRVSITHYSKKSNERLLANDIPISVLASYSQYGEGAIQLYGKVPDAGFPDNNPGLIPFDRMIATIDLTPVQAEFPEAPSLVFDDDEYLEITISNLDPSAKFDVYGKQTDFRSIVALKYNTISIPSGTVTDYKQIKDVSDLLIPSHTYQKTELYNDAKFGDVEVYGDGDKFKKVRIKNDSGYDITMFPTEVHAFSLDTNDVAAYIEGAIIGTASSAAIPAVFTHHVIPVNGAREVYVDTHNGSMKYYTVQPLAVASLQTMSDVEVSDDLSTDALAEQIINDAVAEEK